MFFLRIKFDSSTKFNNYLLFFLLFMFYTYILLQNTPVSTQPGTPIDGDVYQTPDNPIPICPPSAPKTRKQLDPCSSAKQGGRTVLPTNPLPFSPLTPR